MLLRASKLESRASSTQRHHGLVDHRHAGGGLRRGRRAEGLRLGRPAARLGTDPGRGDHPGAGHGRPGQCRPDDPRASPPELAKAGAIERFRELNAGKLHMVLPASDQYVPWTALVIGLWIPNFYYWGLNQYIMQRTLGSPRWPRAKRASCSPPA